MPEISRAVRVPLPPGRMLIWVPDVFRTASDEVTTTVVIELRDPAEGPVGPVGLGDDVMETYARTA